MLRNQLISDTSQHTQWMLQQASSPPVPEVMHLCAYPVWLYEIRAHTDGLYFDRLSSLG